jgi:hypothetical protein
LNRPDYITLQIRVPDDRPTIEDAIAFAQRELAPGVYFEILLRQCDGSYTREAFLAGVPRAA